MIRDGHELCQEFVMKQDTVIHKKPVQDLSIQIGNELQIDPIISYQI